MTRGTPIVAAARRPLTRDDVVRACGELSDRRVAAILATRASQEELLEAVAWAEGESDVMGEARKPLAGRAAAVHEILATDDELWEDDRA